jgi:transposase
MERSVEFGLSVRSKIKIYHHLCIDEKARSKRDFVTVLSDGDTGNVIDIAEGRAEENAKQLIERNLTPIQRAAVQTISMDMWLPFINVAKQLFPYAKICHDPYHLVQHLNKAVDKTRIREVKTQGELKKTKYLFLKDTASFTDKQQMKFDAISKANYEVSRAWRIKENFRDIIRMANREEAFTLYTMWFIESTRAHIPEIDKVLDMFAKHSTGIFNALRTGKNNGKAERLNGSIQELKTIGRGYKDAEHFRTAILFFHGGLVLHRDNLMLNSLS